MFALSNYPSLEAWYREGGQRGFAAAVCDALSGELYLDVVYQKLTLALRQLLDRTENPGHEYESAEHFLGSHGLSLHQLFAEVAEFVCRIDEAEARAFIDILRELSAETGHPVFPFMSAFILFNQGDHIGCIDDLDTIAKPTNATLTLRGQALMELGRAFDAGEALRRACRLDPSEILSWFQLAKALAICDEVAGAWDALLQCEAISPMNGEVALFLAIVATTPPFDEQRTQHAWNRLRPLLRTQRGNPDVVEKLILLATQLRQRELLEELIKDIAWARLGSDPVFAKKIAKILKPLGVLGWMDLATRIIDLSLEHVAAL